MKLANNEMGTNAATYRWSMLERKFQERNRAEHPVIQAWTGIAMGAGKVAAMTASWSPPVGAIADTKNETANVPTATTRICTAEIVSVNRSLAGCEVENVCSEL
jgi:hypothetical protein